MTKTYCCNTRLGRGDVPIGEMNLDSIDFACLTAYRYFCLSFAEPAVQSWTTPILAANSFFPDPGSAEAMRRTFAVLHEMRISRRSPFRFSNPRCQGCSSIVTHDERHLVQLIQAARRKSDAPLLPSAMLLCEGNDSTRLVTAAKDFAKLFLVKEEFVS